MRKILWTKAYITTATRLRYDDTTTHSTTTEVIKITICVPFDCDTTIRYTRYDYDEKLTRFFACVKLEAGARDMS